MFEISFLEVFLSKENLKIASQIFRDIIGKAKVQIVYNKSITPYSLGSRTLVYIGTRKKAINLVAILLIANIIVFLIKKVFLFVEVYQQYF